MYPNKIDIAYVERVSQILRFSLKGKFERHEKGNDDQIINDEARDTKHE